MKEDKAQLFTHYWSMLAGNMPDPVTEYPFSAVIGRKHRFDVAFPFHKIAVEIEGNAWNVKGGGKHMQDADLEKYNIAALLGWRVFRYSPAMLENNPAGCIEQVVKAVSECALSADRN